MKNEKVLLDREIVDKDGCLRPLTLDNVTLHVELAAGTTYQADTTCGSSFMLGVIREVGANIRSKFHWVSANEPIMLFMDNAGGHGTDEAKEEYVKILREEFNVIIEWQVPNSPDTNLLDLGAWVTIQSVVEWLHRERLMNADVLADTVLEAWNLFDSQKLTNISMRWEKVLHLIIKGTGSNDLVEQERGLKSTLFDPLKFAAVSAKVDLDDDDDDDDPNELVAL